MLRRFLHHALGQRTRIAHAVAIASALLVLCGCNSMNGEASMQLNSNEYGRAFDACIQEGRAQSMAPALADRSNGLIETEPRNMGSLIEPWRWDTSGAQQSLESTLQFERRRMRFIFVPVDFEPEAIDGKNSFQGASLPGSPSDTARFDLETYQGLLELRTRVFIERGFTPGIRNSTWSAQLITISTIPTPISKYDGTDRTPTLWTPVGRDEAAERTMMAHIRLLLDQSIKESAREAAATATSSQQVSAPSS